MVFLVQLTHRGTGGWNDIVDKEKQGIFSTEMNSLPDQEVELTNCKIRRHQVFLFVQVPYPSFGSFFHYHRDPVWVFLSDFLAPRATLLSRMHFFVHKLHSPENRAGLSLFYNLKTFSDAFLGFTQLCKVSSRGWLETPKDLMSLYSKINY